MNTTNEIALERLISLLDMDELSTLEALDVFRRERRQKRVERALQLAEMAQDAWLQVCYVEVVDVWEEKIGQLLKRERKSTPLAFQYRHMNAFAKEIGVAPEDLQAVCEGRLQEVVGKGKVRWVHPTMWPWPDTSERDDFYAGLRAEDEEMKAGMEERERRRQATPKPVPAGVVPIKWSPK
jgi:hypothetical protein